VSNVWRMRDEPADISAGDIASYLAEHWSLHPADVTYAPVGGGCHHWIASDADGPRWFVTANHLDPYGSWLGPTAEHTRIAEDAAMRAAKELADRGYEFVVAPLPDRSGLSTRHVLPSWTLLVLPYVDGWSTQDGAWNDPGERVQIAAILGRLHRARPPAALRRWDFVVPGREALATALDDLERPWAWGPYSERTRRRLSGALEHVQNQLERYDGLVRQVEESDEPWVVTHGEPHSANAIRTTNGRIVLIDWGTAQLAPRERDLAALHEGPLDYLPAYQAEAGPVAPRPEAIELFHIWWALAEIGSYVQLFRQTHADSHDCRQSWQNLTMYVPG
jgi:spectinomycin phosphotransferase